MAYAGARLAAGAFCSIGIDADVVPDSDAQTIELGGLHASGEECLPHKVTLGDFLKVCNRPGFQPERTAFFMPTAQGPCRFGQYAPYLKQVLKELGHGEIMVVHPSSKDGYGGLGEHARDLMHTMWMGLVAADITTKFLLKTRPYETHAGDSDAAFVTSVDDLRSIAARRDLTHDQRLKALVVGVERMRDRFRAVPANYRRGRLLVGLVGEIFCRLNTFSNEDVARRIERLGGECWLSDIAEWVWYVNWREEQDIRRLQGWFNLDFLKLKLKTHYQHAYEQALLEPVRADLRGYEEPEHIEEVLHAVRPYLPPDGCLGEMVLSAGKSLYLYRQGVDGIIDISPFTCMNGIVCEAIYPALSKEHDDLPIRNCYFDKASTKLDRDLEIFLDLARAYQQRKRQPRVYPAYFNSSPDA